MNLRVVFFGTPDIAAKVLKKLILSNVHIVGVVSRVDKPQKRSKTPQPSPVKLVALEHNLPLLQPVKTNVSSFLEELQGFRADIFVVVAYGVILKKFILEMPKFGCINLHGSLLPHWRGAAPAQRAIMNGDVTGGVTVIQMNEGMDTGDMLGIRKIDILPDMIAGEFLDEMADEGAPLLVEILKQVEEGTVKPVPQPLEGSLAPKITKEDGFIDWKLPAVTIYNRIRGVSPFPGAWCFLSFPDSSLKKRLLIKSARLENDFSELAERQIFIDKNSVLVGCQTSCIRLSVVQLEGKTSIRADQLFRSLADKGYYFE